MKLRCNSVVLVRDLCICDVFAATLRQYFFFFFYMIGYAVKVLTEARLRRTMNIHRFCSTVKLRANF